MAKKEKEIETEQVEAVEAPTAVTIRVKTSGKVLELAPNAIEHLCGFVDGITNPITGAATGALVFPSQYEIVSGANLIPKEIVR